MSCILLIINIYTRLVCKFWGTGYKFKILGGALMKLAQPQIPSKKRIVREIIKAGV